MEIHSDEFREHFTSLSDAALLGVAREDLVDSAKLCYDEEMARRGLRNDSAAVKGAERENPELLSADREPVTIAEFSTREEADLAQALLESAGIAAYVLNERAESGVAVPVSEGTIQLLVDPDQVEQAHLVLASEISDEELAAEAEAAGDPEDFEEV